jgi:hypothetical protein
MRPPAPVQRRESGYGVMPRRPSLEREQRPIFSPGLSTSPGAHSGLSGQPSAPPAYSVGSRVRRDSLSPPVEQGRRESVALASHLSNRVLGILPNSPPNPFVATRSTWRVPSLPLPSTATPSPSCHNHQQVPSAGRRIRCPWQSLPPCDARQSVTMHH